MSPEKPLSGRSAIVTGASRGIGRATAHALAAAGADVAVAARSEDELTSLVEELTEKYGVQGLVVETDVREERQVETMVQTTVDAYNRLDILVNNAGVLLGHQTPVEKIDSDDYLQLMEVNVNGTFFATRAALPHLREVGGNLIFIGSGASQSPRPYNPIYAASKWWMRGFAQSVEGQVGNDGVAVTLINPTEVRTEIGGNEGNSIADRFDEEDILEPAEVGDAVVFVATRSQRATVDELNLFRRDKLHDLYS